MSRRNLIAILLLWLAGLALRLTVLAVPPVTPQITAELKLSATGIGILGGLPIVLFALAAVPGALLISRVGAYRTLLIGLMLNAIGCALRGAAPDALTLYAMTALMAAGIAMMQPSLPALVRQWTPAHVGFGTAVFTNGLLVGEIFPVALTLPVVVPLVGGSWRLALVAWAIPVLLIAAVVMLLRPPTPKVELRIPARWWPNWHDPLLWKLGLTFGTVNAMYFAVNAFLPDYLTTLNRADLISSALTAVNFGQLPASLLMLALANKLQGRTWPFGIMGIAALLSVIGLATTNGFWLLASAALLGFCCAGVLVLALALPPLLYPPEDVPRVSAAMFTLSYGCAVVVPVVSGVLWDVSGVPALAFVPIGLCAVLLIAWTPTFKFVPRGAQ
ncbi:MAG TPA: MFS transporter [Xanthobacteraceae bacterium]